MKSYGVYDSGMNKVKKSAIPVDDFAAMGLYSNDFSRVFSELVEKTGVSCYRIGQYTYLNEGYLSRLKSSEKRNDYGIRGRESKTGHPFC